MGVPNLAPLAKSGEVPDLDLVGSLQYLRPKIGGNAFDSLGFIGGSATGTLTAATMSATNRQTRSPRTEALVTAASATAVAGYRLAAVSCWRGNAAGLGGFYYSTEFGPATGVATATSRLYAGLTNALAAPTDVQPSSQTQHIGVGYDSADTNLQIMHNAASTTTKVDLGASFPVPTVDRTGWYRLEIWCDPNDSLFNWRVTNLTTGAVATGQATTNIPAAANFLSQRWYASVGGTSSVIGIAIGNTFLYNMEVAA